MNALMKDVPLTSRQAREITDRINAKAGEIWSLLDEAYSRKAWLALGYGSWRAYATTEFAISQSRAYQLLDQARIVTAIQEAANSTNVEISEAQAREIKPIVEKITSEISQRVAAGADPVRTTYEVIEASRHEPSLSEPKPTKADPRDAEIERLREELAESRDNARELAAMVEASDFAAQGEASAAKQIKRLLDEIATLKSQRDSYMTKCNQLIKTVNHWKNKAGAK